MASQFDESDFVDSDYQNAKAASTLTPVQPSTASAAMNRPLTRQELESKVGEAQNKLAELKRAQEELERERAALEEARRRRIELETGRSEMIQHLTRGIGLLEEAEFNARRDAEQMSKTLGELREALAKVQAIREETWSPENWQVELTRALTDIENARMEWNRSRLKWTLLKGGADSPGDAAKKEAGSLPAWDQQSFAQWCRIGLALTGPLLVLGLLGFGLIAFLLLRQ